MNNTDPRLGPLADNGEPTQTHALLLGSPAIDAGSPDCPPPATDQRGVARAQDGDGNLSEVCDIGSYEVDAAMIPVPGDEDGDGVLDAVDNCPAVQNAGQADGDGDLDGDACDNCPATANADQANADGDSSGDSCDPCTNDFANDADADGVCAGSGFMSPKIGDNDNCPYVANAGQEDGDEDVVGNVCDNCPDDGNAGQENFDGDENGDACDDDDDNDEVFDVDEGPCGGDPFDAGKRPERLDTPGDDDGDTIANEALPSGSDPFDCDGDGWSGNQENLIFNDAPSTARNQDPCGNGGWPAELANDNNRLNIGDVNSFTLPARPAGDEGVGGSTFNMFNHQLDDDGDTAIESDEDPGAPGGATYNVARWNLQTPPHAAGTLVNIGDLNALVTGAVGSPARPPMFDGQPAFFTDGGMCQYPP